MQNIRFVPVKVSQTFVFGFMYNQKKKKKRKMETPVIGKASALLGLSFICFLGNWSRADTPAPNAARQGVFPRK